MAPLAVSTCDDPETDDGAYIYVEYGGRADMATGLIVTAPTFQTGDERYAWLNRIWRVAPTTR